MCGRGWVAVVWGWELVSEWPCPCVWFWTVFGCAVGVSVVLEKRILMWVCVFSVFCYAHTCYAAPPHISQEGHLLSYMPSMRLQWDLNPPHGLVGQVCCPFG